MHRFAIALDPSMYSRGSGITALLHVHALEMPATLSNKEETAVGAGADIGVKGRFPLIVKRSRTLNPLSLSHLSKFVQYIPPRFLERYKYHTTKR